jgi:hypothetical protein
MTSSVMKPVKMRVTTPSRSMSTGRHAEAAVLAEERIVRVHAVHGEGDAAAAVRTGEVIEERTGGIDRLATVDGDNGDVVSVDLLEFVDVWHFLFAGLAPGSPEVDEDNFPAIVAEAVADAVEVIDLEVWGELADRRTDFQVIAAVRPGGVDDLDVVDALSAAPAADEAGDREDANDSADDNDEAGQGCETLSQSHGSGV